MTQASECDALQHPFIDEQIILDHHLSPVLIILSSLGLVLNERNAGPYEGQIP